MILWRLFQQIAVSPARTSTQVPGSGTSPPPPSLVPQGFPFPLLLVVVCAPPPLFFFLPTPQTLGSSGGEIGTHVPLPNGSNSPNGGAGPNPTNGGRFNADSKGIGGPATAVPIAGRTGSSNFAAGGSDEEVACCGTSSTRFPQRERAVILPSVIRASPVLSETRCRLQKTLFPIRYETKTRRGRSTCLTWA